MSFHKYSSDLKPFAKKLRSTMTLAEVLLWKRINRSQLGVRFNRQKPIGKRVVDFYCKELHLAIEVDGRSHDFKQKEDIERQKQLEALGVRFLRFWDTEVKNEMESVIQRIRNWIEENPPRPAATPPQEGNPDVAKIPSPGGVREARGGSPSIHHSTQPSFHSRKSGVALIVVMWVLLIVSLIVSSFAFEMKLEANIITAQRKRFKADQLARAGIELAKAMFAFEKDPLEGDDVIYDDPWLAQAAQIDEGVPITYSEKLGDGTITLKIDFEKGRRNIRTLDADGWRELFAQTGIPSTDWDELYDCLVDWQDPGDEHQINGAESDDEFYRDRGYECKNAPVDTVDELLLIKGWTEEVVYGTPPDQLDETEYPLTGLAENLTIWGDGKVNPNSATPEVLRSLYLSDQTIDAILELRLGPDGEPDTEDDGLTQEDFGALGLDGAILTLQPEYVTVTSEGEVNGSVSKISAVFRLGGGMPTPLFWLEER